MHLSERISRIKPSPTLAINAKAQELRRQGVNVISFGGGEPDFDTPQHIREAAVRAMGKGFTRYTAVGGLDELKDATIEKIKEENPLDYDRPDVLVSYGGEHFLYNLDQGLLNTRDEASIPTPYTFNINQSAILQVYGFFREIQIHVSYRQRSFDSAFRLRVKLRRKCRPRSG